MGSGATSLRQRWVGNNFTEMVSLITLDKYVTTHEIARVDLIKCDVEGAEKLVFFGAKKVLQRWHPILFFEAIENHTRLFHYDVADLLKFIQSYDYTLYYILNGTLKSIKEVAQNGNYLALPRTNIHDKFL